VRILKVRGNLEAAAALPVEEGRKYRRGIEVWKGQKVNRVVHAHQGNGLEIANNAIFFNGFIASGWHLSHSLSPFSLWCLAAKRWQEC
jgi:hypothetical protein